ncbi:hypothetical protein TIFTF001_038936 [Ficus carica]|uniref:Uncharacterized protein n=1 Tax=Ficus carica TaxID=3494 RepID=A0AA88JEI9_FICCA|nr:hypothetical protein TIFTF001_038936 [Ficus carica]
MKAIKEDSKVGVLMAFGEDRWDQTEANTEEELALKDIMDSITDAEKVMLADPFKSALPFNTSSRRNARDSLRKYLNSRIDREGSVVDIERIQQIFCLDRGVDYDSFCWELLYFTPDQCLKIDDKFLRQKVENVEGYKIPKTLAPILKTFICKNNGDLGMEESLTPQMKSIAATLVCIAIDRIMCRTKFEDITWDDLKHWYFYLKAITLTTGFRLNQLVFPDQIIRSDEPFVVLVLAFLGLEAIRCKENSIGKLQSEIAEFEAGLERCKGLLEKRKGFDKSSASDFMKDECFKVASEFKGKDASRDVVEGSASIKEGGSCYTRIFDLASKGLGSKNSEPPDPIRTERHINPITRPDSFERIQSECPSSSTWLGKKDAVAVWVQGCFIGAYPASQTHGADILSELIRIGFKT